MVDVAVEDGEAGVAAGQDQGDDLVQGRVPLHPHHLQAGHHDFADESISELKDTLDELPFLAGDEAPFLAFIDDMLDFTLQIFRLRDNPPGEHLPETLEEAGVRTVGLFHALASHLLPLLAHKVFHGPDFPGKFQAPVQHVDFVAFDAEQFGDIIHRLLVIEFLAGKNIQAEVAALRKGVNADMTFSNEDKPGNAPIIRHFADDI